jgi:nucleoside-diphosphate-sugar epimerase
MRILIVGGAGEVGKYLISYFMGRGHEMKLLDRAATLPEVIQALPVKYIRGDITDATLVNAAVQGTEVIIHLAWSFADDAPTIFNEDIRGHVHLLEAAASAGVRHLLYTSTAVVYGRASMHPVTENHPCLIQEARKPLYGLGKYTAEELCKVYCRDRKVPATIFRFWWAFGDTISGRHLRDLVKKALNHQPLEMVRGAGGAFVTMTDLGRIMDFVLTKLGASGQVYNVGSLFITWEEIGEMMIRLTNSKSSINLVPSERWKGPAFLNEVWDLSWEKAERELRYTPEGTREQMRSQLSRALQACVNQVIKEGK